MRSRDSCLWLLSIAIISEFAATCINLECDGQVQKLCARAFSLSLSLSLSLSDTSTTRWKWSRVFTSSNEFGIFINIGDWNNKTMIGTPHDRCVGLVLLTLYNILVHTYTNCLSFYWISLCSIGRATCREALKRSAAPGSLSSVSIWATRKRYSSWNASFFLKVFFWKSLSVS
jgi:hypothetical protein